MRTFTLDTNCLIDIEESRPAAREIRALADAHTAGAADVAVIAMSASENPKRGHSGIHDFLEFQGRLAALGLAHLNIVLPMMYWGIAFWGHALWADNTMGDLERQIHLILFPNLQFLWQVYCRDNGIDPPPNSPSGKWRNHKCDVQAIWSHIHSKRNVFVTSDKNFHDTKSALIALGAGRIEYPDNAVKLL